MIRWADDSISFEAINFCGDDEFRGRMGAGDDGVVGATGTDLGRDNRSAVSAVNRTLLLTTAFGAPSSAGGLNRGGGKVSTVGEEISVTGELAAAPLDLDDRTLLNLGDDMDKGDGVVAILVVFATAPPLLF